MSTTGGRFDFDDGGTYAGGWEDGKANGYGICTGPKGQGKYAGAWHMGFEISGVYEWSNGNNFKGQWMQGKRHGVGIEVKGRWIYQGEWTQGFKGRYGVRQSTSTGAKYEGTWTTGLQDGYGVETYADGGIYQGQWLRGIRHGYGLRQSVPYGLAACHQQKAGRESLTSLRSEHEEDNVVKDRDRKLDEKRGGFVLSATRSEDVVLPVKKRSGSAEGKSSRSSIRKTIVEGLKLRKQRSTGDIQDTTDRMHTAGGSVRSTVSNISHGSYGSFQSSMTAASVHTDSNTSFISQDDIFDVNMIETYTGEWKNDKRSGFGVSERSDGLKYEGEWDGNKRHGYGSTTFRDGTKEEGKYKNNVLITSGKKSKLFLLRANKLRDRVQNAVTAARNAAQIALQKSDIAVSRMASARSKAELAVAAATKAEGDAEKAKLKAADYAPEFVNPMGIKSEPVLMRSPLLSFGDHYDISVTARPKQEIRKPLPTIAAKTILSRVANIAGVEMSNDVRKPPPSIASALVSVAMDSSAPLVKNFNQRGIGALAGLGGGLAIGLGGLAGMAGGGMAGGGVGAADQIQTSPHSAIISEGKGIRDVDGGLTASKATDSANSTDNPFKQISGQSENLNQTVIDDRFDQYQTWTRSSALSRNPFSPRSSVPDSFQDPSGLRNDGSRASSGHRSNDSTDSGISSNDPSRPPSRISRRQSLNRGQAWDPPQTTHLSRDVSSPNRSSGLRPINENGGINFSTKAAAAAATPVHPPPSVVRRPPPGSSAGNLRRTTGNRGSMPDVVETAATVMQSAMTREEVHLMSLRRREEIRREKDAEARRRQDEVVLSFAEFREWCRERQLIVLVLAVNISLATMFFNLLTY